MTQNSFGKLMRYYRRSSQDKLHGGNLSQDRLADLLAEESGISYSRGAISDWERSKGHIHKDTRHLLISLIRVLYKHGGIRDAIEANDWLASGNYRRLNSEETAQISEKWLNQNNDQNLPAAIFTTPSLPPHDIIGRDELLNTIRQQLFSGHNLALSAINGLPGVGKTTLALLLAHDPDVQARFPDGVLWVGLGRNPDTFHQLGQWAHAVGVPDHEIDRMGAIKQRANAVHVALQQKRLMLVIDDVWDSTPVSLFKLGGPDCVHVLTTRKPRIAVEFAGIHALKVSELSDTFAFELLRRLAPQVVNQEPDAAWELVRASGGLPLALVLIGNHLRVQAAAGRKRRIRAALSGLRSAENRFQLSTSQPILDHDAHPSLSGSVPISLRTIIGVSEDALSSVAKAVLYALSLFPPKPNSFTEEAAVAVSTTDDADTDALLDALDELSDNGLLETTGRERYTLHQSINEFARLESPNSIHQIQMVQYYTQFIANNAEDQSSLDRELDNITAALKAAKSIGRDDLLWELLDAIFPFLEVNGYYDLVLSYLNELAERDLPIVALVKIQRHIGLVVYKSNQSDLATAHWERGLALARSASANNEMLTLLTDLSMVASQSKDYVRAENYLLEAKVVARSLSNWRELCRSQANLGRLAIISDRYTEADTFLADALDIALMHNFPSIACAVYNMRGLTAMSLGNVKIARQHYFDGLQIARANRFKSRTLALLTNLGHLLREMQQYEEAVMYLEEGLELAREFKDQAKEGHILMDLGIASAEQFDLEQAIIYMEAGYAIANAIDNQWLMGLIEARWGVVELLSGQIDVATRRFEAALRWANEASNNKEIIGLAQFGLAQVAFQTNHLNQARKHLEAGKKVLEGSGHVLINELNVWESKNLN